MSIFRERLHENHSQLFTMDAEVYQGETRFQNVLIFENRLFGRVLALDGVIQLTERDNHIYHEMIAHVPLLAHGAAKRVLIIGGGDGGTLKEVLKHPVDEVVMVELDDDVVSLSKRYLPQVSDGAFDDERVDLIIGNGVDYVTRSGRRFDLIIVDSTDPIGPGEQLFTESFYEKCRNLVGPTGLFAAQSGTPFHLPEQLARVCDRLGRSFTAVRPYLAPVPSFPGGMLALVVAGECHDALRPPIRTLRKRYRELRLTTGYYTPEIHRAAFTMPPFTRISAES
jgi:spermidine synthase